MALVVASNSYGSRAEADIYFGDSINNDIWDAFTNAKKDQGLVEATRLLERQTWAGEKEDPAQDLHFPATGLTDCSSNSVDADDSLETMKEAQFEYAIALLQKPSLLNSTDTTGSNVKGVGAGSARVDFFRPSKGSKYPLQVLSIAKCFFLGNGASSAGTVSGNCDSSSFTDDNKSGLIKGFK